MDVKTATKVRFQEPGVTQQNGVEEAQEKLLQESETSNKGTESAVEEGLAKTNENTETTQEEAKLLGGSPKQDNKENAEKEAKESQEKKEEVSNVNEAPQITP